MNTRTLTYKLARLDAAAGRSRTGKTSRKVVCNPPNVLCGGRCIPPDWECRVKGKGTDSHSLSKQFDPLSGAAQIERGIKKVHQGYKKGSPSDIDSGRRQIGRGLEKLNPNPDIIEKKKRKAAFLRDTGKLFGAIAVLGVGYGFHRRLMRNPDYANTIGNRINEAVRHGYNAARDTADRIPYIGGARAARAQNAYAAVRGLVHEARLTERFGPGAQTSSLQRGAVSTLVGSNLRATDSLNNINNALRTVDAEGAANNHTNWLDKSRNAFLDARRTPKPGLDSNDPNTFRSAFSQGAADRLLRRQFGIAETAFLDAPDPPAALRSHIARRLNTQAENLYLYARDRGLDYRARGLSDQARTEIRERFVNEIMSTMPTALRGSAADTRAEFALRDLISRPPNHSFLTEANQIYRRTVHGFDGYYAAIRDSHISSPGAAADATQRNLLAVVNSAHARAVSGRFPTTAQIPAGSNHAELILLNHYHTRVAGSLNSPYTVSDRLARGAASEIARRVVTSKSEAASILSNAGFRTAVNRDTNVGSIVTSIRNARNPDGSPRYATPQAQAAELRRRLARRTDAATDNGKKKLRSDSSKTSEYYKTHPEARAKRVAAQAEINKEPDEVKRRSALRAERRKRGIDGKGGPDVSHTASGKTVLEDPATNRARNGHGKQPRLRSDAPETAKGKPCGESHIAKNLKCHAKGGNSSNTTANRLKQKAALAGLGIASAIALGYIASNRTKTTGIAKTPTIPTTPKPVAAPLTTKRVLRVTDKKKIEVPEEFKQQFKVKALPEKSSRGTDKELLQLDSYISGSAMLNRRLRSGQPLASYEQEQVLRIDSWMAVQHPVEQTYYRGIASVGDSRQNYLNMRPGDTFTDPGFGSYSRSLRAARQFAAHGGASNPNGDVRIMIRVKNGKFAKMPYETIAQALKNSGADKSDIIDTLNMKYEEEYLSPRNAKFVVKSVRSNFSLNKDKYEMSYGNITLIDVEYVGVNQTKFLAPGKKGPRVVGRPPRRRDAAPETAKGKPCGASHIPKAHECGKNQTGNNPTPTKNHTALKVGAVAAVVAAVGATGYIVARDAKRFQQGNATDFPAPIGFRAAVKIGKAGNLKIKSDEALGNYYDKVVEEGGWKIGELVYTSLPSVAGKNDLNGAHFAVYMGKQDGKHRFAQLVTKDTNNRTGRVDITEAGKDAMNMAPFVFAKAPPLKSEGKPFTPEQVLDRITKASKNLTTYDKIDNNCEAWARMIVTGKPRSVQADHLSAITKQLFKSYDSLAGGNKRPEANSLKLKQLATTLNLGYASQSGDRTLNPFYALIYKNKRTLKTDSIPEELVDPKEWILAATSDVDALVRSKLYLMFAIRATA